jgi:hypothetical protein
MQPELPEAVIRHHLHCSASLLDIHRLLVGVFEQRCLVGCAALQPLAPAAYPVLLDAGELLATSTAKKECWPALN